MENNENQSSIQALLFVLRRRMLFVLLIGICTALVAALITVFFIPPVYSSTAKFYVNNTSDQMTSVSQQDIYASQSLAESAIVVVKNSAQLLQSVIDEAGVDCSTKELKNNLAAGTYSGTEAFHITVSSEDPKQAYALAEAFYKIIPDAIPDIINKGDVSQMDPPRLATEKDSPSVTVNTMIGGIIGLAVAFLVFFLMEALDNTIYTEDDIKDKFGYPIVGAIPTIAVDQPQKKAGISGLKKGGEK